MTPAEFKKRTKMNEANEILSMVVASIQTARK